MVRGDSMGSTNGTKLEKVWGPQSKVSLNREVGHARSKNIILNTAKGASSVWIDNQTHMLLRDC